MPNPDDFAAYLNGISERISDAARAESYKLAVGEAIRVISYAAEVREAAVAAGFSMELSEEMAMDFWTIASGFDSE
ncbi:MULTISPECIES: hypothetical protein [unclassified Streptomyces]|uniref:hypothetical protein n=1 Tax=unclassified Streptomyces TaxID=2593676 RepID=UPI0022AF591C|nr:MULTISPECIES: hypothetical protein [unclassified Streptomyces]MCZ4097332.1 hypothetical protein [Streptomyces sp. H39-C1]MCZ4120636.1 hypothetical protein [Streptomyces sp. H39-S7]